LAPNYCHPADFHQKGGQPSLIEWKKRAWARWSSPVDAVAVAIVAAVAIDAVAAVAVIASALPKFGEVPAEIVNEPPHLSGEIGEHPVGLLSLHEKVAEGVHLVESMEAVRRVLKADEHFASTVKSTQRVEADSDRASMLPKLGKAPVDVAIEPPHLSGGIGDQFVDLLGLQGEAAAWARLVEITEGVRRALKAVEQSAENVKTLQY